MHVFICVSTCEGRFTCACGGQKLTSRDFLGCSPSYTLRQGLLLEPELGDSTSLAGQLTPGIPYLCSLVVRFTDRQAARQTGG